MFERLLELHKAGKLTHAKIDLGCFSRLDH
jgi:hypothetical protein